ncbi:hypothetical protein K488DRAFT_59653 [Vararia minispora EC-137]|uniref:Uncharacterized protein n=1 Tax=Vararia minispora EC-137 TaxID=1314806 RepID=A0ACB8Q8L4_9AGAM|nr:hypothetical protein K488DRAFT_59653 [Vararia minispora EC-137]
MPQDDPRDVSRAVKRTPPAIWTQESADAMGTSGMFLAGMIMVTRNRYLAWPSLMFGVSSYINYHPLRTKEGQPPIANLLLSFAALIASYVPLFLETPKPVQLSA